MYVLMQLHVYIDKHKGLINNILATSIFIKGTRREISCVAQFLLLHTV